MHNLSCNCIANVFCVTCWQGYGGAKPGYQTGPGPSTYGGGYSAPAPAAPANYGAPQAAAGASSNLNDIVLNIYNGPEARDSENGVSTHDLCRMLNNQGVNVNFQQVRHLV